MMKWRKHVWLAFLMIIVIIEIVIIIINYLYSRTENQTKNFMLAKSTFQNCFVKERTSEIWSGGGKNE